MPKLGTSKGYVDRAIAGVQQLITSHNASPQAHGGVLADAQINTQTSRLMLYNRAIQRADTFNRADTTTNAIGVPSGGGPAWISDTQPRITGGKLVSSTPGTSAQAGAYWVMPAGASLIQSAVIDVTSDLSSVFISLGQADPPYASISSQRAFNGDVTLTDQDSVITRGWFAVRAGERLSVVRLPSWTGVFIDGNYVLSINRGLPDRRISGYSVNAIAAIDEISETQLVLP